MSLEIKRILYPTDFSVASLDALSHALLLAEQYSAELDLLHAQVLHEEDPAKDSFPEPAEILSRLFELAGSELHERLGLARADAVTIQEVTRRGYSAPEVILDYQKEVDGDLIVMSTHGRRGAGRFFLGSVTEAVLRHAECPVLTLRAGEEPRKVGPVDRILVPLDFSEPSRDALLHARELARAFGAELQLLYVVQITSHPYFYVPTQTEIWEKRRQSAVEAIEELSRDVLGDDVPHQTYVAEGRPATEIAAFAEERDADLIVIATHGLSGLERIVLGSTTAEVVRSVDCPVFTVRTHGKSLRAG